MNVSSFLIGYQAGKNAGGSSGGSGGGTLPAGVYWEAAEVMPPLNYPNCHFVYNGELYLWAATAANTPSTKIYKWANGVWTEVVAFSCSINQNKINDKERNGKLHVFGTTIHFVFDGETVSQLTNPPTITASSVFEFNGFLYAFSDLVSEIYKWDESSDTWAVTSEFTGAPRYGYNAFNYGGKTYVRSSAKLYMLADGVFTEVATLSESSITGATTKDNYLYYFSYGKNVFYKLNLDTYENAAGGAMIPMVNTSHMYAHNNTVHIAGGANMYRVDLALHEVESTE